MTPKIRGFAFGLCFLLGACADDTVGPAPVNSRAERVTNALPDSEVLQRRTLDDDYAEIATKVPGFGGLFLSDSGTVANVFLTDATNRDAVEPLIAQFLIAHGSPRDGARMASEMRIQKGAYDFKELSQFYDILLRTLRMEGVTSTDIDETRNRIVFGVLDAGAASRLREVVGTTSVPGEAVEIVVSPITQTEANLQQYFRPFISGLQIVVEGGGGECSAGFLTFPYANGGISGDGTLYFLTASHCTPTFGVNDGVWVGQPTMANPIGFEVADPALQAPGSYYGCPTYVTGVGTVSGCRGSDAALFAVTGAVGSFLFGSMAKTVAANNTTFYDTFYLQYDWSFDYPVGTPVRKTGRTKGTTAGTITNYCVGLPQGNPFGGFTGRFMTCQIQASYASAGGDSGGPVIVPHPTDQQLGFVASVQGIHWGSDGTKAAYASWGSINAEIKSVTGFDMTARYY